MTRKFAIALLLVSGLAACQGSSTSNMEMNSQAQGNLENPTDGFNMENPNV